MRESGLDQQGDRINVSVRNHTRLILQNRRLLGEVFKLEQMISAVIERSAAEQWSGMEESEQLQTKYRGEQEEQLRTIKQLKQQLKAGKASLAQHKYDEVRNEENQLTFLKRQCHKLMQQRDTLALQKREKDDALQYHLPINAQTATTEEQYKKARLFNGELKAKVHQLQRQVAKYHHLKEMAKTAVPPQYQNPEYHIIKMDTQIANMRKEMRRVDEKWRSKVDAIDREYFAFKNIRSSKLQMVEALEKDIKNYEIHVAAMRDEQAVASDRQRISSVIISPQKRRQMQELIEEEKKRLKRLSPKTADKNKHHPHSKIAEKQQKQEGELKLIMETKEQNTSEILPSPQPPQQATQYSEKKERRVGEDGSKGGKMMQSVGVGTSFYYSD